MKIFDVDFKKKKLNYTFDDDRLQRIELVEKALKNAMHLILKVTKSKRFQHEVAMVLDRVLSDIKEGR